MFLKRSVSSAMLTELLGLISASHISHGGFCQANLTAPVLGLSATARKKEGRKKGRKESKRNIVQNTFIFIFKK